MLWIPGPTHVRDELLAELTRELVGHRSKEMVSILERIDPGLRHAFGLEDDSKALVGVGTHSATAMMEGCLLGVGPRVLAIVNGAFSKRWGEIARIVGKEVTTLDVEWGGAVAPEMLQKTLEQGSFDAVTLVVNETSTGVRTPLEPVAEVLARFPQTQLFVDVVSGIAGFPIDFDANGIDFALAGVNKALALPPGITVLCASERFMERARATSIPSFYLDPVRTLEGHRDRKTPTTPAIPLYRALARQLEDISSGLTLPARDGKLSGRAAWTARYAKHERMRERALAWGDAHGYAPFPARELSSQTVTCFAAASLDVATFITNLAAKGFEIGNGYGPLKGETFRIGHMGDHTEEGLEALLAAADAVLG